MHFDRTFLALTFAAACCSLPAQELAWQKSLDAALQTAADQQQVLLIAVLVPGERDSEALVDHYRDANLRKLTKNCVCLRIDIDSERGDEDRLRVLEDYLGAAPRSPFVAPHHLVVHPDGKTVISSAAHRMTAGQLEWFVADGIRKFDGTFQWPLNGRMRAPAALRYEERETTEIDLRLPPSKNEVRDSIAALKKGTAGWAGSIDHYRTLMASDEKSAVKFVDSQLSGGRGMITGIALSSIARFSPVEFAPILEQFLDYRKANRRREAAKGMWQMAPEKSRKAILKQLKRERDGQARAWLLRAAVAVAPTDKATRKAVEEALYKDDDKFVRMHAAVAAGALEEREVALRLLRKALDDREPDVRSTAAYAMAARRDRALIGSLEASIRGEGDAETKRWMEEAMSVLSKRGDLSGFERVRSKMLREVDAVGGGRRDRGRNKDDGKKDDGKGEGGK